MFEITSDINLEGRREKQTLRVDGERLEVRSEGALTRVFDLRDVTGFRTAAVIGSGLLQARVEGVWLDLLRYSNRLKFNFDRAAKSLEQIRQGVAASAATDEVDPQRCPSCGLMLEFAGETCPRCLDHGAALARVVGMIRPYRKTAVALFVLLFVGLVLDMAWPLLTRFLVDYVLADPRPAFTGFLARFQAHDNHTLLIYIVGALATVHVIRAVLNMVTSRISSWVGNLMCFEVRSELVHKLEALGLAYYSKQETGSLVGRVAYDTEAIQSFMGQITSGFVMQFCLVVFSFLMMFALEPSLALWALVPAPFVLGGAVVYWRYVHPRYQRYWDRTAKQAGLLNGILTGIRVVKSFAKEEFELDRFQRASGSVRSTKDALDGTAAFFYPFMGIVFQVGGWIIWYVGGLNVLNHEISLGTLMAFFGYLSMFYGPLGNLTNLTTWLTQFSTQMHRISEILDAPTVIPESSDPVPLPVARGEIEFDDVVFSYTRGAPVLNGVSFRFAPGEQIGIVGRSGSGKTSLINLIYRFYDVEGGAIRLDGVDIRSLSKEDLRRQISIVLQEPFLFHGTLLENIAYGQPDASLESVLEASRAASAHDFVMAHQLAYETSVGERGQELSGGERQRISIARALLRRSSVLILDEATSAIDSESEMAIQSALDDIGKSRTTILIAHRLSTLKNCDRILVIENGEVAECGSHRELMEKDGLFARWVRMQQGQTYHELDDPPPPPVVESYKPCYLKPGEVRLSRGERGDVQVQMGNAPVIRGVFALRCFPISHPDRYVSLRYTGDDGRVREAGIISDLSDWPETTQIMLRSALARQYLFHRIQRIYNIRKFSQFLSFSTKTDLGPVDFVVRYGSDGVKKYGERGRLLMDIEDNLYVIPSLEDLRRPDRIVFDRHIYW